MEAFFVYNLRVRRDGEVVTRVSAKHLRAGSIPARASNLVKYKKFEVKRGRLAQW